MTPTAAARSRAIDRAVLGRRLRSHRLATGLHQSALGAATGVSAAYISRIETGARRPSTKLLERFAVALGTTVEAILEERPAKPGRPGAAEAAATAASRWLSAPNDPQAYRKMLRAVQAWEAVAAG